MKTAIIFDLDGTLLDTLDDLSDSVNYTLRKFGYPERRREEIRGFVGNGVPMLIRRSLPSGVCEDEVGAALEFFKGYYSEHCMDKTGPYDGILDLLCELRKNGFLIGVVSNKIDSAVKSLCQELFGGLIDIAVGQSDQIPVKPDPTSVRCAMQTLCVDNAIYVGDSEVDIQTASNSGIPCVSVCWGFKDRDFLQNSGAKMIAQSTDELLDFIYVTCNRTQK